MVSGFLLRSCKKNKLQADKETAESIAQRSSQNWLSENIRQVFDENSFFEYCSRYLAAFSLVGRDSEENFLTILRVFK